LCGARGRTAAELANALHEAPDAGAEGLRATSAVVQDVAAGGSVTLRAPSVAWVQSGLPLRPEFTSQLGEAAAAAIARVGFAEAPEAARAEINRVIAERSAARPGSCLPAPST
jgi:serine protease inhibitor